VNKHQDNIPDGPTYSRTLGTRVNAGRPTIDFAEAIHNNKNVDNIGDGTTYSRTLGTRVNSGRPVIDFSEAIHSNQNLDHVPNGTRAAWDSTTQKTAAVDSSGNLILKNKVNALGSTAFPTQPNNTYAVIPEMTTTVTTNGNKILVIFTGTFCDTGSGSGAYDNLFAIYADGVRISPEYEFDVPTGQLNFNFQVSLTFIDSPSAGSHTYDVLWKYVGINTAHLLSNGPAGTARCLQVVELG